MGGKMDRIRRQWRSTFSRKRLRASFRHRHSSVVTSSSSSVIAATTNTKGYNDDDDDDSHTVVSEPALPRTLKEALPSDPSLRASDPRAIVVTQATRPFNVIGINTAWENLCGYKECETLGKSPEMLQGEDTNVEGLKDAVAQLFRGQVDVKCDTVNYRKDGSRFRNHLRMGPIYDEVTGEMTHFVGILKNVGDILPDSNH